MQKYNIVMKKLSGKADHWRVYWDGEMVYEATGPNAESSVSSFTDGLERGITGSKESLDANSRVKIKGWMDYLEAFDTYEDYRD